MAGSSIAQKRLVIDEMPNSTPTDYNGQDNAMGRTNQSNLQTLQNDVGSPGVVGLGEISTDSFAIKSKFAVSKPDDDDKELLIDGVRLGSKMGKISDKIQITKRKKQTQNQNQVKISVVNPDDVFGQ